MRRATKGKVLPGLSGDVESSVGPGYSAIWRDGQSMQTIASTDPITGESVRIDVTLNVIR